MLAATAMVVVVLAPRAGRADRGDRARGGPVVVMVVVCRRGRAPLAECRVPHRVVLLCLGQGTLVRQGAQPAQQLAVHLTTAIIFAVKGAALLALFAVHGGSIAFLGVGAALALAANEGSNNVAILAGSGLSISFDVLLTFFADCVCTAFVFLLKFCSAVGALYNWEGTPAIFTKLLSLRKFFEWMTGVAPCTCEQCRFHIEMLVAQAKLMNFTVNKSTE